MCYIDIIKWNIDSDTIARSNVKRSNITKEVYELISWEKWESPGPCCKVLTGIIIILTLYDIERYTCESPVKINKSLHLGWEETKRQGFLPPAKAIVNTETFMVYCTPISYSINMDIRDRSYHCVALGHTKLWWTLPVDVSVRKVAFSR